MMVSFCICMNFVQIAGKLNNIIKEQYLRGVGQLEQDLVFGDAGTKELINFFRTQLVIYI
jgi:syntaxin-binding protein 1